MGPLDKIYKQGLYFHFLVLLREEGIDLFDDMVVRSQAFCVDAENPEAKIFQVSAFSDAAAYTFAIRESMVHET